MGSDVLDVIKLIEESLRNKQKIYFMLSVLSPYGVIYWFYPEEFSINTFLFSFILFTFVIHFVYDIYLEKKNKIIIKIRNQIGLDFVNQREKISSIQGEILNLINNLESDRKGFNRLNVFNKKIKNWIINSYKRKNENAEMLSYNMKVLENKIYNLKENKDMREELKNYKELDYFILFTASSLCVLYFFAKNEISSGNIKLIFSTLFVILLVADIMCRNIKYVQLWFSVRLFKKLCLLALMYFKRMNKKYEKQNELKDFKI